MTGEATDAAVAPAPAHAAKPARRFLGLTLADVLEQRRRAALSFTVGLVILLLVQIPTIEQSFLGDPDRQMMETAFQLRGDLIGGLAEPVLFLDFDDRSLSQSAGAAPFKPPLATVPRASIADLLDFVRTAPPSQAPHAVIVDVDVAQPASDGDAGVARLRQALAAWAAATAAPPLVIVREPYAAAAVGLSGQGQVLPDTPYDDIVQPAPDIFWAQARVLTDEHGVVREFRPYDCVLTRAGVKPLYSAALIAYQFTETDSAVLQHAAARHWMADGAARCVGRTPAPALPHGERIDYHLSMGQTYQQRVWPNLDPAWPGFAACGHSDSAVFRRLSVVDVLDAVRAGGDVSHSLLCRHVVIIGGANSSQADFVQTPLDEMSGAMVLANAVRGLQLTHGGMRAIPLIGQVLLLALVTAALTLAAAATHRAKRHYKRLRRSARTRHWTHRFAAAALNPVVLNGAIAFAAQCVGVALLAVSLNFGLWGYLSAPAFGAAITQTIQEFSDA